MRGFITKGLMVLPLLLILGGCATVQPNSPVVGKDLDRVLEAFRLFVSQQGGCRSSLDVDLSISFDSMLANGVVDGYLQTMAPGLVKLIGVNPLGQPLFIIVSDGDGFQSVFPAQGKSYEGRVGAASFQRYVPEGLDPALLFYWLIGRIPPGPLSIYGISHNPASKGVWIDVVLGIEQTRRAHLQFDPGSGVLLGVLLGGENHRDEQVIEYDDYGGGECRLPGRLKVYGSAYPAVFEVVFSKWRDDGVFHSSDFVITVPKGYTKMRVE
ncbi:MAG: hypothetical protein KJ950_07900 [Proteobacteria bacterium]|nr:hypothetical protein [Pseudomonadota bacterium]MBU1687281.1 hypothetical protein [Pseudomonadota bacterium]